MSKIVVLTLLNIFQFSWSNTNFVPIVGMELSESGFHRDIVYDVHFDSTLAGRACEYALEQHFPPAIYVSVDQLNDLKRLRKLNSIYPEHVDVEAVTEKSQPFTVILKGIPQTIDSIKLPIHYRYHEPSKEHSFVEVELTPPQLYVKCLGGEDELIDKELLLTPHIKHCLEVDKVAFTTTDERDPEMDCNWRAMKVDYQFKSTLYAKIPVGDANAYPLVLWLTIIASWGISLWTFFNTRAVPMNINKLLEQESRIENKKRQ